MSSEMLKRADISIRAEQANDLAERYPRILEKLSQDTGFVPTKEIGRSTWWGKKVGAVIFRGIFEKDTPAVLKIEALKMQPDEITEKTMIQHAKKALEGSGIRPPNVYEEIPWTDEDGGYSAIIMEDVPTDSPVLPVPGTREDIEALLAVRERYRRALQENHVVPWVAMDTSDKAQYLSHSVATKFASWRQSRKEIFPTHPFSKPGDAALIDKAIAVLTQGYTGVAPEFQNGHFSHRDVVRVGDEIVLFSNLYWAWRAPFYDAVFPSHWYLYEVANVPDMTIEELERQRDMWNRHYNTMTEKLSPEEQRLFALARIERYAAGLNLDALSISDDPKNEIARYVVDQTRTDLTNALAEIF